MLYWLWAVATATTTVFRIRRGRGFDDAASVLGADFAGGLGRDGWAPYRQFTDAFHQTCLGHLLRRCRLLQRDHPRARFPARVARLLWHALKVRNRWAAGTMSAHGVVTRKMCGGGNRSPRGADTQQVLVSILRTAHQRGLDSSDVLTTLLRAGPYCLPAFLSDGRFG